MARSQPAKLPRLPRRPQASSPAPPVPSPYKTRHSPKVVYLSTRTPFVSAIKRVRGLLKQAEKRATQSALTQKRSQGRDPIMAAALATLERDGEPEEVLIKATGRSIEKAMGLALYFQQQGDCQVQLRTGTVDAIDDVVDGLGANKGEPDAESTKDEAENGEGGGELPESRIRHTSMLEVAVTPR